MATKKTVVKVEKKVRYGTAEWINGASVEDLRQFARKQQPKIDLGKLSAESTGEEVARVRSKIKSVLTNRRSKLAKSRKPVVAREAIHVSAEVEQAAPAQVEEIVVTPEEVRFAELERRVLDLEQALKAAQAPVEVKAVVQMGDEKISLDEWSVRVFKRIADLQDQLKETVGKEGFKNLQGQIEGLRKQFEGLPTVAKYEAFAKATADEIERIPNLVKEQVSEQRSTASRNGTGYVHESDLGVFANSFASALKEAINASNLGVGDKRRFFGIVDAARKVWEWKPKQPAEESEK